MTTSMVQITAAIDFGTTYSGYAYSYEYNQDKIYVNSNWSSGSNLWKVPTAILFDKDQKFIAFGDDAENKYCQLAESDEEQSYFYFNQFKMMLYNTHILRQVSQEPGEGGTPPISVTGVQHKG